MKTASLAVLAAVALTACAHAPAMPPVCQAAPQWYVNDPQGKPVSAVFICFGNDSKLLYATRALTPEQIAALEPKPAPAPATAAKPKKATAAVKMADPCSEMEGQAYTKCRILQKANGPLSEGLKAVK